MTRATQFVLEKSAEIQAYIQGMSQQDLFYLLLNILAVLAIIRIIRKEIRASRERKQRKAIENSERFIAENKNRFQRFNNKSKTPKWYPSGWVWNDEKQLWEPPDYMSEQARRDWIWDEEKKIWKRNEKQ